MVRQSLVVRGLAMQGLAMQDLAMQDLAMQDLAMQDLAMQGSAGRPRKPRPILSSVFGLTLGGFALTLLSVGGAPSPAAAFGGMGFGHMGGFGGSGMGVGRSMGPSMRAPVTTPRRGTYIARPAERKEITATATAIAGRRVIRLSAIRSSFLFRAAARRPLPISRRHRLRTAPPASTAAAEEVAAELAAACRRAASDASCLMK
jgi:hypothetical protein